MKCTLFELEKAMSCSKGLWCRGRPFDKLRVTDRGRSESDEKFTGAGGLRRRHEFGACRRTPLRHLHEFGTARPTRLFFFVFGEGAGDAGVGGEPEEGDEDKRAWEIQGLTRASSSRVVFIPVAQDAPERRRLPREKLGAVLIVKTPLRRGRIWRTDATERVPPSGKIGHYGKL
jgi:hypothetical protein